MGAWYSDNDPRKAEQAEAEELAGGSFGAVISRTENPAVEKVTQQPAKKAAPRKK